MSTVVISVKDARGATELSDKFANSSKGAITSAGAVQALFKEVAAGLRQDNWDVHVDATNPAAASGSIALTQANLGASDAVTLGGQTITCKASGAAADGTEFNKGADVTASGDNLAAAINVNAALSKYLKATNAAGTVTIAAKVKGGIGNLIVMSTTDATAFGLTQLTGGTGGPSGTPTTFTR